MKKLEINQLVSFIGGEYRCTYLEDGGISCINDYIFDGEFVDCMRIFLPVVFKDCRSENYFD